MMMNSYRMSEREAEHVRRIVDRKVQDYINRQNLHTSFDERGGSGFRRPAIQAFQNDDLISGCRYHRKSGHQRRKYANPGMTLHKKEFVYVYKNDQVRRLRDHCDARVMQTANALFDFLPVTEACTFYNRQYFCKNSRYGHKVMHNGAIFNFNHCPCRCSNLTLEKKVFESHSTTPDHEQNLEGEDGCNDDDVDNDVSRNSDVRESDHMTKKSVITPMREKKLPNRLIKSAPTSRKVSQHERNDENDEDLARTKTQKEQSNHTISATSTTFTDPTSSKSSLTPGDSFARPKSKVSTKTRSEARERAENERREKQQGYSSSEEISGSSSDESKTDGQQEEENIEKGEGKTENGQNSLATTASIESTD